MTTASQTRASRGRRTARPSGDDRELAILATLEQLLEERPFAEISVDDLAKGAGISRPTFYFYFPSKDAVLLTLFERVIVEADAAFEGGTEITRPTPRVLADGINAFFEPFGAHRAVVLAGASATAPIPRCANSGRRSCRSGSTTPPPSSRRNGPAALRRHRARPQDLPTSLNLMNERTMFASFARETARDR